MKHYVFYDQDETTVYVTTDASETPDNSVKIGEFDYDAGVNVNRTIYHYVRDILSITSKEEPTEFAKFPDNITDMARLSIVVLSSDVLPTSITVDATLALEVDATATLDYEVLPATATDKSVTFSSSAEAVATVSEAGLVTAIDAGTATITITSVAEPTVTATVEITVT